MCIRDRRLLDRGIAYAPDFVANAGGVMRATLPIFSTPDRAKALPQISGLYEKIGEILRRSDADGVPTEAIAEQIALERIRAGAITGA